MSSGPCTQGGHYHPNAKNTGGCPVGCCDYFHCPDCGKDFTIEYDG